MRCLALAIEGGCDAVPVRARATLAAASEWRSAGMADASQERNHQADRSQRFLSVRLPAEPRRLCLFYALGDDFFFMF